MLMIEKGPDVYGIHDDDINRIVQDYRSGRIDDAAFQVKVAEWKTNWHRRIAEIVPGHTLQVLVDASNRMPVFRLNPNPSVSEENVLDERTGLPKTMLPGTTPATGKIDEKTGLPKHLLPQRPRVKSRGPFGRG
jgi:hypothetical protein